MSNKRAIEQYDHRGQQRTNNPPVGLVSPTTDREVSRKVYSFDPHLDPQLGWAGKAEHQNVAVTTVSLHVHERIDPRTVLEAVRRNGSAPESDEPLGQMSLFEQPKENPPIREAVEFYKHPLGWSNRLVAGDSLIVMNSLLEKEGLGGQVQMVYFDPPYGVAYKSNFQPFVNKRQLKENDADEDLTQEPETLKAFRDTWELGIHSYLTYLRDRLRLCKELLHESGSCFVQISDENVHFVRNIMDEVFGAKCFVVTIPVKKKGSQKSGLMDPVNDYLVWYARSPRDEGRTKFHPLLVRRELDAETLGEFRMVELADGREFPVSALPDPDGVERDYRLRPRQIFQDHPGARLFRANPLTSGGERSNQSLPFKFKGRTFNPGTGKCWKTTVRTTDGSVPGMDRLTNAGRLIAGEGQLHFKRYLDDFGFVPLSNWWDGLGGASDPVYVVQTNTEIVQRCMLMTTDPGDLVLDPTCGSGTTAWVAEDWGRRWITCDTSRVAVTLAKQRLMTWVFDYYELAHPAEGVRSGFAYETVPHVTLGEIANNPDIRPKMTREQIRETIAKHAKQETLYDQPKKERRKVRVSGPFTVEAVPAPAVRSLADLEGDGEPDADAVPDASVARDGETHRQGEWRDELLRCGVRARKGGKIEFARIEPLPGCRWLHADGETSGKNPVRFVASFGPEHAPLEQRQVELALEEARTLMPKPGMVVFAAFQFDPEAAKDIDETSWPNVTLLKVQMNTDLATEDLKRKRASNESFWLVGQPEVKSRRKKGGLFVIEVCGFDYFDPREGKVESGGPERIAMWLLDTDYDGRSLFPRQVFFPMASKKDGWARLAKNLKAEIDEERIEAFRGLVSLPFKAGKRRRAAVKIIDDRGIESLKVVPLA